MFLVLLGGVRRVGRHAGFLIALVVAAGPVAAQADDPVAAAAADDAARVALIDLRLPESPTPEDYEIAARLLGIASELAPKDADLARLETAAAFGTGEPGLLAGATARVVALDPSDTVAQLRLITARIAQRQTAEERLALYEKLLGPAGVSIDHTVRSRLAVDAALIEREQGNLDRFLSLLTLASSLDQTNKEARHLASSYFAEYAGEDPDSLTGELELNLELMWADPIDPNVHFGISRELAVEGAMREALRFYEIGMTILYRAGLVQPRQKVEELAMRWLLDGPRFVLDSIEQELKLARDNARIKYELDKQRDVPDRLLTPPDEVFLDPLYEKIRIIAAMDAMDKSAVLEGLRELDKYTEHEFKKIQEATTLDDEKSRAKAFEEFTSTLVSAQFMRMLANVDVRQTQSIIPQIPKYIGEEKWNQLRRPLEAWVALRTGDLDTTRAILQEIGAKTPAMRVCRAELLVAEGKDAEAAAEYEYVLRHESFVPFGAWARSRAMELTGRTDPVTPAGRRMQRLVAEVPASLDHFISDPAEMLSLKIEPVQDDFPPGERARLKITVMNTTPWPLSIGPSRTISSRFLLGVDADDVDEFGAPPQPVVVDMDRRLRLDPTEKLSVEVGVEAGLNGMIFDAANRGIIRQRWQGWQSPTLNSDGAYVAGPYGLSDSSEKFTRSTRPEARLPGPDLAAFVGDAASPDTIVAAVESAAAWLRRGDGDEPARVVSALTERYLSAGPTERALMVSALPTASQVPAMAPFDEMVRRETGLEAVRKVSTPRVVAAMVLVTRVTDADDPLLAAAAGSGDESLVRLAALVSDRLREGRPAYSKTGRGLAALAGSSKATAAGRGGP
ncbi:MAG: hypothetical protein H6810_04830 [Phycisphaeraceae bacterium]|nr:MAG: hypothetical protein H6810_04830 [Phycisphaeraceae bacterium]